MSAKLLIAAALIGGVMLARSKSQEDGNAEQKAMLADFAELPAEFRNEVVSAMFTSQKSDIPQLQLLANALDAKGYKKSAARVRMRIAQLQAMP
jgi:hypothetical protein